MRPGLEVNCQDLVELVTDYFEGRLAPDTRRRFEDHLVLCEGCATYVEQMRTTTNALGGLSGDALDPVMRDRLLAAFRGWRSRA